MFTSPCPDFSICGSCPNSNIPYEQQLSHKLAHINVALGSFGLDTECCTIVPSPKTSHYRNRMDFVIAFNGFVGLRARNKWWKVLDNHKCFIASLPIEEAFDKIRGWVQDSGLSYYDRKSHAGLLRYAVVRCTLENEVLINIITSKPSNSVEEGLLFEKLLELGNLIEGASIVWSVNSTNSDTSLGEITRVVCGNGYLVEKINECRFMISPQSFFQTNPHVAELLNKEVCNLFSGFRQDYDHVLDLYCGSGFFSIPLAKLGFNVQGVEMVSYAVKDARENNSLNDTSVGFVAAKLEDLKDSIKFDCPILLDPSRAGLHSVVLKKITQELPPAIVYVSCNYKRFCEEMVELTPFYKINQIQAFDMFPHTEHVEVVFLLTRQ